MSEPSPKTLASLCEFINGHGFTPRDWAQTGLPIIRIQNLNGSSEFNYFAGTPEPDWIVEPGALLFAWAGSRGVSFGAFEWQGPRGVLNQHILRVVPRPGIDRDWLYFALRTVTDRVERKAHGFKSTLLHVRRSDIIEQTVDVPPLPEQQRVAEILKTASRRVRLAEAALNATTRRRAALIQHLLSGKRRFPEHRDRWGYGPVGEYLTESRVPGGHGGSARKITVKLYGRGVIAKEERLSGSENTKYYSRKAGQFIYSKLDFLNGAFGIIPAALDGYESTLDLPCFDISDGIDPEYLLAVFLQESFYSRFSGQATGGRKARRINPEEFLAIEIPLPSIEEQRRIVGVIRTIDREIALIESLLAAYRQQRQGLMQQLLTGRRRVHVPTSRHAAG